MLKLPHRNIPFQGFTKMLGVWGLSDLKTDLRGQVESRRFGRLRLRMMVPYTHTAKLKAN